jgi:hypothetical protein
MLLITVIASSGLGPVALFVRSSKTKPLKMLCELPGNLQALPVKLKKPSEAATVGAAPATTTAGTAHAAPLTTERRLGGAESAP